MQLVVLPAGGLRCLYDEVIDLHALGSLHIRRGSRVEPDESGQWFADMSPCGGPTLGPFHQRSDALQAERGWLQENWLTGKPQPGAHDARKSPLSKDHPS